MCIGRQAGSRGRFGWRRLSGLLIALGVMICPLFAAGMAEAGVALQSNPPRYLIIAPDDLVPVLAGYVAEKQAQGYDIILKTLSQTGQTPSQIRSVVLALSPQFLLLVGDVDMLPAWESRNGLTTLTDLYYTTLDGAWDYTPNLAYARLPVHSAAELQSVLTKWSAYKDLDGSQPWLSRAAFIASGEPADYLTAEQIHTQMIETYTLPAGFSGQFPNATQPGGDRLFAHTYAATPDDLTAAFNAGRGLAVYFGQGGALGWNSPYFTSEQVQQLSGPPLPLLVSFASRTAELKSNQTAFAEAWLLHPASGALAVIAAGADTTRTADERLERELFRVLFSNPAAAPPVGEALRAALLAFSGYYMPDEILMRQYYEMYAVWGDPTQRLWLDAPQRFSLGLQPQSAGVCAGQSHNLSVEVQLNSANLLDIQLSLSGQPPGVSAEFSPNPASSPGSSALTLTVPDTVQPGEYPLTVSGENGSIQQAQTFRLTVNPAAPAQTPLALLPANGENRVSLQPRFEWSAVEAAAAYQLQISMDIHFETSVLTIEDIPQPSFELNEELQPNHTYYWRVRAVNGCGEGGYSPVAQFTTLPPLGECPLDSMAQVIYQQPFDSPPSDWTLAGGWQIGSAFERRGVAWAAAPAEISQQNLTSPRFALPAENITAVFLQAQMAYDFGDSVACLDGSLLQISTDGSHWQGLPESALTPAYDGVLAVTFGNPLGGKRAWCHRRDWSPLAADLSAYRNQEVFLRFVAATGADGQAAEGMALDNFQLIACRLSSSVRQLEWLPKDISVIRSAGESAVFDLTVANRGSLAEAVKIQADGGDLTVNLSKTELNLPAGGEEALQVQVNLPPDAVPNSRYAVSLRAVSPEFPSVYASAMLNLTVRECVLTLNAPVSLPALKAGEQASFDLTLSNLGNDEDSISLDAQIVSGWPVSIPKEVTIGQGKSQLIEVTVNVPETALPAEQAGLQITAESTGCPAVFSRLERVLTVQGSRLFLPLISH